MRSACYISVTSATYFRVQELSTRGFGLVETVIASAFEEASQPNLTVFTYSFPGSNACFFLPSIRLLFKTQANPDQLLQR